MVVFDREDMAWSPLTKMQQYGEYFIVILTTHDFSANKLASGIQN